MSNLLPSLFSLAGKHALVVGGGSGIGAYIAVTLAAVGARVTVVGRTADKLNATVADIAANGGAAQAAVLDVTALEEIAPAVQKIADQHGDIDILVNAAGNNPRRPAAEISVGEWRNTIDVNLSSGFFLAQAVAPMMLKNGDGKILNIASLQSRLAFANGAPYGAAKAGVCQLTRALAREWSASGINVNAIAPGFFPTELTAPIFGDPEKAAQMAARTAIGRNGRLQDLRGAVIFFTSAAAAYITGQTLYIDGGFTVC